VAGMTEKNKDQLQKDLLELMKTTQNRFILSLFPDQINSDSKKRPTTAGDKIRGSAIELVEALMKCQPSYIRCIKWVYPVSYAMNLTVTYHYNVQTKREQDGQGV
jgi:myosin-1